MSIILKIKGGGMMTFNHWALHVDLSRFAYKMQCVFNNFFP